MEPGNDLPGVGASLLTDQQERYFSLLSQVMNNVQARKLSSASTERWEYGVESDGPKPEMAAVNNGRKLVSAQIP